MPFKKLLSKTFVDLAALGLHFNDHRLIFPNTAFVHG